MIKYWWNPVTNARYDNNTSGILETVTFRNLSTNILKTPKVLQTTRQHFNCSLAKGMQLENQGSSGSLGSHWEKTLLYNEFMNPSSFGGQLQSISNFTFSLLEDTNWFKIAENAKTDPLAWGRNRGCDFFEKTCQSTINQYPEFTYNNNSQNSCGFDHSGVGYLADNSFTDNCKIYQNYNDAQCQDILNTDATNDRHTLNKYGENSRCFVSNILSSSVTYNFDFRCFTYNCQLSESKLEWILEVSAV